MDWHASGILNRFEFEVLDLKFNHIGWLDNVTGGSIEESYRGDYRVSASLDIDGQVPAITGYVRIWHVASLAGETVRTCLATLCPDTPALDYELGRWTGSIDLYSALKRLDQTVRTSPGGIGKNTLLANYFKTMVGWGGATALIGGGISKTARSTKSYLFEFGEPVLSNIHVIADALGGYVEVDPQGRICLVPYVVPSKRGETWRLGSGDDSILLPGLSSSPAEGVNRVAVRYETDAKTWYATSDAPSSDPRSRAQTGRVVAEAIDVDTVVGGGSGWLQRYADNELKSRLSTADLFEARCLFDPSIRPGTVGTVDYNDSPGGGSVTFRAFCSQREIELDATMAATLTLEVLR